MRSFLLALSVSALGLRGDHGRIEWFEGSFEGALAEAGKSGKLVFVDFFTKTCPPCRNLDVDTFNETSVMNEAKSFVCLAVDAESDSGRPLAARYGIAGWPALVFLEKDGSLRDRLAGFRKGEQFVRELHRVQSGLGTFGEIERKVAANPADVVARLDLVARLRSLTDDRWISEMETAHGAIAKGEGFDPRSPDDRYAIATRLRACGDPEGAEAQVAAIRSLDPERRSAAGRRLALDELLARPDSDPSSIRTFLEKESHPSVLFDGWLALRDRFSSRARAYDRQGQGSLAAGARAESRAAAREAWKHCPPDRAAEFGRQTAMEFTAVPAELDESDRDFAVEVASKASALVPRSVDHLMTLAQCLEIAGRKSEALETLRHAAEIDPTCPGIRELRGTIGR